MRILTPIWTMRRWKSAARARWRCGGCCRNPCWKKWAELDPAAIAQVRAEAWPDVRDADELHDVLHTLVALPEACDMRDSRPGCPVQRMLVTCMLHAIATAGM